MIVGVMLPYIHHPYFSAVIEGISKEALRYGYQLLLFQTNYDVERELEALERLRMKQMDGLIVCSHEVGWEIFDAYQEEAPIVLCEQVTEYDFFTVYIDHYQAFAKALHYLVKKDIDGLAIASGEGQDRTAKREKRRIKMCCVMSALRPSANGFLTAVYFLKTENA